MKKNRLNMALGVAALSLLLMTGCNDQEPAQSKDANAPAATQSTASEEKRVPLKDKNGVESTYYVGTVNESGQPESEQAKEFTNDGQLIYEGSWLEGKRNGFGVEYEDGKKVYEGEWLNGKRHGQGTEYWKTDGSVKWSDSGVTGRKYGKS
jgi:hypothetical protein